MKYTVPPHHITSDLICVTRVISALPDIFPSGCGFRPGVYIKIGVSSMQDKIYRYIKEYGLIAAGDKVIAAVSGGPDSMALLHILKGMAERLEFTLYAAHLNHGLRRTAGEEEEFVARCCQKWNIPFHSRQTDVARLAREDKRSLEDAGRAARYAFFHDLAEGLGASRIATAHHANDVAETVLLHLLRGSGIKGLRGIMPVNGMIVRPLLTVSKEELLNYLKDNGIEYCLDESNLDPAYLRNRIRHELLPYLKQEYNPRIVENLNRLAEIARDENEIIEEEIKSIWDKIVIEKTPQTITVDNKVFTPLPLGMKRRVALAILAELSGEAGWEMNDVNKIIAISEKSGSSLRVTLKKAVKVNKCYDRMIFTTGKSRKISFVYEVPVPGEVTIEETGDRFSFSCVPRQLYQPLAGDVFLDYDKLPKPLFLRSRQEGDVIRLRGLNGRKKIKDLFIDAKIPYHERAGVPLLAGGGHEVYAVLGQRVAEEAEVRQDTVNVLVARKL